MAGKKINDPTLIVGSVNNNDLIPISSTTGGGVAQVCQVSTISNLIKNNIGITLPDFSTTNIYLKGDLVAYNGKIYKFTAKKEQGNWDSSCVVETSIVDELNGMSSNPNETINVVINSTDSSFTKSGIQVDMIINSVTTSKTTDSDGVVTFEALKGVQCTIQTSDLENYYHIDPKIFTTAFNSRTIILNFIPINTSTGNEIVNVSLLKYDGNSLTNFTEGLGKTLTCAINGGDTLQQTIDSTYTIQFQVPKNSTYRLVYPTVSNFIEPMKSNYTASQDSRLVKSYYVGSNGNEEYITIACSDGSEYTVSAYQNLSQRPNGVAVHVNTPELSAGGNDFYIKKETETVLKQLCSSSTVNIPITDSSDLTYAKTFYSGKSQTKAAMDFKETGSYSLPAFEYCNDETLTLGSKTRHGFVISTGQAWILYQNLAMINSTLALIGGYSLNLTYLWASLKSGYWNTYRFWFCNLATGSFYADMNSSSSSSGQHNARQVIAVF